MIHHPFESPSQLQISYNIRKKNDHHLCSHNSVTSVTAATTTSGEHRGDFPLKKKKKKKKKTSVEATFRHFRVYQIYNVTMHIYEKERERERERREGREREKKNKNATVPRERTRPREWQNWSAYVTSGANKGDTPGLIPVNDKKERPAVNSYWIARGQPAANG